jgi:hypothetical protein
MSSLMKKNIRMPAGMVNTHKMDTRATRLSASHWARLMGRELIKTDTTRLFTDFTNEVKIMGIVAAAKIPKILALIHINNGLAKTLVF